MSAAFPTPVYTTTAIGSGWASSQRLMSRSAPSPQSLNTTHSVGLGNTTELVVPETAMAEASPPGAGQMYAQGWFFRVSDVFPGAHSPDDLVHIDAGLWTFLHRGSRPGGLLTGNINVSGAHIRISVSNDPPALGMHTPPAYVGEGNRGAFTVTTTSTDFGHSVPSGAAVTARADQLIHVQLFFSYATHLTSDTHRVHTNINTGARLTVVPNYRVAYGRGLGDSPAVIESVARSYIGGRSLPDSAAVSDALARRATFPRGLTDSAPVADGLARQYAGNRALSDVPNVSDGLNRAFTGARAINDSPSVDDELRRGFSGGRSLADPIAGVGDTLTRLYQANRTINDDAEVQTDTISRHFSGARELSDAAPVTEDLQRAATYKRKLAEKLSEGGGETIIRRPIILLVDET